MEGQETSDTQSDGRKRRSDRGWVAGGLIAVLALAGCGEPPPPPYHPNVLVVVIDALRSDRVGANGYERPTTPHLDAIAAEGATFRRAYSHSTWTKPSIASLFTSTYPVQHGMNRVAFVDDDGLSTDVLAPELVTVAERFRQAGYATAAAVNQPHLQERFGFAQGFDLFAEMRGSGAYKLNAALQAWLGDLEPGRPFFAYLHYLDVHWPYTKRLDDLGDALGGLDMERPPPRSGQEVPEWVGAGLSPRDLAALEARYDHEIAWTDRALGVLWSWLEENGFTEDLLLVVTSDHGEGFLEHGELLHGYAPYEEVVRIPLVVRPPPALAFAERWIDTPVGLIDLLPSLLDLCDLEPERGAFGRSFRPLLDGEGADERTLFIETEEALAALGADDKLLRFVDGRLEYYELNADPGENAPAAACTGRCRQLARALGSYLGLPSYAAAAAGAELSAEEIEDLRSLGYLD